MQITDKITLNLSGEEVFAPIVGHQGDLDSRVVECALQKDGLPYVIEEGTTARATYRAASGVSDIHDAEIVGNAVVVPLIPSFLASPGLAHCDVQLYQAGKMLGTGRFAVLVSPMAAAGQDLEKSPEYQSFVAALADADQWKADTAEAISKATEATEGANTAAQGANAAAASVDAAKQAAIDAAGTATTAAEAANTAANGANTAKTQAEEAAQSAQTAATRANEAAEGIESTGIIAHMQSTSNPHQVTAEQVGAMAADAIQSGSNSNGSWIKLPDGTMMAYGVVTSMTIPANGTGAISTDSLLFPVAFSAPPIMTLTLLADTSTGLYAKLGNVLSNLWWGSATNTGSTERTVKIHWQAIGRWK